MLENFDAIKRLCAEKGTDCRFNSAIICICDNCHDCGWCPAVEEQRKKVNVKKYAKKIHRKTRSRKLYGSTFDMNRLVSNASQISIIVTSDERGKTLSMADDRLGIMLTISADAVKDLLKVVEVSDNGKY